ncbi:conserved hypothetical protein [Trichormus variabilis ATCC 29413]|uniref:Uncharacterized protein n=2 Tax=Anabaena variabilis TaxID=264691 RepID=Q3MFM4_TRIV2|nr:MULTISPECIES: hypothetical protein [Nostocaceae]ABA20212.1 conserved hypothetical protein [Trichormus variabilis ATCC 29413]MBD2378989.1 hypothetical protein [Trichormus variabilis FACHB-319]MBC1217088.1 hypothetical protein [Trichormus variabilis ARAD]MBC1257612.1 hypothetical protein [Trichormus variabilis V5]MBC1268750.1 hypothetical protein [Trichormus variabilis FSR]
MKPDSQNRLKHFAALKSKYAATEYQDSSSCSPLYCILRKTDLGIELSDLEFNWLRESKLDTTLKFIQKEQQRRQQELINLEVEFSQLKSKYKAKKHNLPWQSSNLYCIVLKLESGNLLTDSESQWLRVNGLADTDTIAQEIKQFTHLKYKYKAHQYQNVYPHDTLYKILKKLDLSERLNDDEYNWLINHQLWETVEIFKQQESAKEAEFSALKSKYQASKYQDKSLSDTLYKILLKIEAQGKLIDQEIKWLKQQGFIETIAILQELEQAQEFAILKVKYKANQYSDSSPKSHLYKVLKIIEGGNYLSDQDINFLKKRKLTETIQIADEKYISTLKLKINLGELLNDLEIIWLKSHGRDDIINLAQQQHFAELKRTYGLVDPLLPIEPFYTIMLKLEKGERLDPLLVIKLQEEEKLSRHGKIAIAHYKLEAEFYEQELQRTGNKWHIPTASSYWRKADEPKQSLKVTDLSLDKIKESKLKSAILVTRGGAFRDMSKLGDAENCARKAMEYHPDSYQPYTLMGAIFYDRHDYSQGDYWFEQAIQRGAKTEDIDDEIKRVLRGTRDEIKRHEAAEYLLRKDARRYSWAKSYLIKVSR